MQHLVSTATPLDRPILRTICRHALHWDYRSTPESLRRAVHHAWLPGMWPRAPRTRRSPVPESLTGKRIATHWARPTG